MNILISFKLSNVLQNKYLSIPKWNTDNQKRLLRRKCTDCLPKSDDIQYLERSIPILILKAQKQTKKPTNQRNKKFCRFLTAGIKSQISCHKFSPNEKCNKGKSLSHTKIDKYSVSQLQCLGISDHSNTALFILFNKYKTGNLKPWSPASIHMQRFCLVRWRERDKL